MSDRAMADRAQAIAQKARQAHEELSGAMQGEGGGFRVDDPYGAVRADYNPRASDDAYWHKELRRVRDPKTGKPVMREGLVTERSVQKNSVNGLNDWGAASARQLDADESKGASSFISSDVVVKGMQYIQIFNRPKPVEPPRPRPRPADL